MLDLTRLKLYCKDEYTKIENYDKALADNFEGWVIHHRLELTLDGDFAHSRDELLRMRMYYHRPYFELILLTRTEHARLHNKGKTFTSEHRCKLSDALKGRARSTEIRKKISEAKKAYWARRRLTESEDAVR